MVVYGGMNLEYTCSGNDMNSSERDTFCTFFEKGHTRLSLHLSITGANCFFICKCYQEPSRMLVLMGESQENPIGEITFLFLIVRSFFFFT